MRFIFSLLSLVSLACAVSVDLGKRATPLDVKLELVGNTAVKATITNTGAEDLKVFKTGTFLDKTATEKVEVFQADSKIPFDGIRLSVSTTRLDEEAFQVIAAGDVIETEFDIAHMHDLGVGGVYDIVYNGAISYAEENSTKLAGVVPFSSNIISTQVDGVQARTSRTAFLEKRTIIQSTCTGAKKDVVTASLGNCASWANKAQAAAASGSADKLVEYFKSSSASVRSTVSGVFQKEVSECGSTTSGLSKTYCSDPYGACDAGVLAYTLPSQSYIAYCDLYFTALPPTTSTCHNQDQAGTTVHETTHLSQIKGTSDYGVYGYAAVRALSALQNLNHADTYALYAQAIVLGC